MNYIITKHPEYFEEIGEYNYCNLEDMDLKERISIDLETTGLKARKEDIFCTQIGTGVDNYIIHMYDENYTFEDIIPFIQNKILVGANILFDLGFMYKHNFYPKQVKDVMLASKIIYNGDVYNITHDFGSMMKRELGIVYDKTDQKNIHIVKLSQPSTIKYSFNDVDKLLDLCDALEEKIDIGGFRLTYDLHNRYIRALAYIEQCGMPISSNLWKKKMEQDIINTQKFQREIEEYVFDNLPKFRDGQLDMFNQDKRVKISLTSPIQMVKVFDSLGINTKDKDGKPSIGEEVISKTKHEFVDLWLKFQEANHRVSTFGEGVYSQIEKERIYTNFNPMVDTARLSTRKGGINFLNFPADKETRSCFKANEGNVMVVADFSAQEGVIMADLSKDEAMTKSVVDGADLHCMLARVLFPELAELSDEEITKQHKSKRQDSKVPRFLFSYGGNAFTLHTKEGFSMERSIEIEKGFKELHAGLYKWGQEVYEQAIKVGYIESADGWKLKLPKYDMFLDFKEKVEVISKLEWAQYKEGKIESKKLFENPEYRIKNEPAYNFYKSKKGAVSNYFKLKSEYQRLALNNPVQSRGAHQLKLSTILFFDWIEKNNLYWKVLICNSPHDEIIVECEEFLTNPTKKNLSRCMIEGGNHYLTDLTINAEANSGSSWGEAK
jgi:DNA polymerase I